jgi:hypothetical protein
VRFRETAGRRCQDGWQSDAESDHGGQGRARMAASAGREGQGDVTQPAPLGGDAVRTDGPPGRASPRSASRRLR